MRFLRSALVAVAALLCFLSSPLSLANDASQSVYFAGFAFTGEHQHLSQTAPHTDAALAGDKLDHLNARIIDALKIRPPQHLELNYEQLARLDGSTSATVMAAALDRETVSIEPIGSQYKVVIELAFQALFFDFRQSQVIASYPITLQHIDLLDTAPGDDYIRQAITQLLVGHSEVSLPHQLTATLQQARLPEASLRRLQVGPVRFADAVLPRLPTQIPPDAIADALAQELSKAIAASTGLALLPPASGSAVGGAMAARFADGKVYQLTIPEADYVINYQLDALRHGTVEQTAAMSSLLFGAFFTVSVVEPISGQQYFSQPLRRGASKVVPATQTHIDLWAAYQETVLSGMQMFAATAAGDARSRQWLAEQKPGGRPLSNQVKSLQELIQSCR